MAQVVRPQRYRYALLFGRISHPSVGVDLFSDATCKVADVGSDIAVQGPVHIRFADVEC